MILPNRLFRYRPASTTFLKTEIEAAAKRNEVWCNTLDALNDPFEAHPSQKPQNRKDVADWIKSFRRLHGYVSTTGQSYHDLAKEKGISKSEVRKKFGTPTLAADQEIGTFHEMCEKMRQRGTSCSFSEIGTSVSMWALYCANHAGYCQIWKKRPQGKAKHLHNAQGLGFVVPVNYQRERPNLSVTELSNMIACSSFPEDDGFLDHYQAEQSTAKFGGIKSDEWKREAEWRLISFDNKGSGYLHMGDYTFEGVVLGINCAKEVEEVLDASLGSDWPVLKATKSQKDFAIEFNLTPHSD